MDETLTGLHQLAHDCLELVVVDAEHRPREIVQAEIDDLRIQVAHFAALPRRCELLGVQLDEVDEAWHALGLERRLHNPAVLTPELAFRRQQAVAEQELHPPQHVRLDERLRMVDEHVLDRLGIGDHVNLLHEEAGVDDPGGLLAGLVELQPSRVNARMLPSTRVSSG